MTLTSRMNKRFESDKILSIVFGDARIYFKDNTNLFKVAGGHFELIKLFLPNISILSNKIKPVRLTVTSL